MYYYGLHFVGSDKVPVQVRVHTKKTEIWARSAPNGEWTPWRRLAGRNAVQSVLAAQPGWAGLAQAAGGWPVFLGPEPLPGVVSIRTAGAAVAAGTEAAVVPPVNREAAMRHSRTSIINTALMRAGAKGVTSVFQDSPSAQTAAAAYDRSVAYCLSLHPWNFALKHAALAQGADAGGSLYCHAYPLPSDCLRVVDVDSGSERITDWTIMGRELLCDAAGLRLLFVSAEVSEFPDAVADAIAWRLAAEIAPYMEQGGNVRDYLEMFERSLDRARVENDIQRRPMRACQSLFLKERRV